jgi:nucleotide-binding universal stress UspA family protein
MALRRARSLLHEEKAQIIALHVIDGDFVKQCIRHELDQEGQIKKNLFMRAKNELRDLLHEEGLDGNGVKQIVCEGIPFLEINRKAVENHAEMIVMGSRGKAGDMNAIFFGSTTEKVLRFITRPVLCVPPAAELEVK